MFKPILLKVKALARPKPACMYQVWLDWWHPDPNGSNLNQSINNIAIYNTRMVSFNKIIVKTLLSLIIHKKRRPSRGLVDMSLTPMMVLPYRNKN